MDKKLEKILKKLIKETDLLAECNRLVSSGAIDISDENEIGKNSKVLLKVALENMADNIRVFGSKANSDYKNLKKF